MASAVPATPCDAFLSEREPAISLTQNPTCESAPTRGYLWSGDVTGGHEFFPARALRERDARRELACDRERDVEPRVFVGFEEFESWSDRAAMVLALEVDQERGLEDQRRAHLSSGGASCAVTTSMRSSSSSVKQLPRERARASSSLPVIVLSGHRARRTTSLNDSPV